MLVYMKSIGAFEAKTRFGLLLQEAAAGQVTVITKNGKPVATIAPYQPADERLGVVQRIRTLRKRLNLRGVNVRELINEDREP